MCLALVAPWVAVPVYFGSLTSNSTNAKAVDTVLDSTDSTTDALELDESDAWELERSDAWRLLGGLTAGWVRARTKRAPTPTCLSAPCAADHMCDLAGRRGGSGGLPPTARDSARFCHRRPPTRALVHALLC
jgi:hypothetical protein